MPRTETIVNKTILQSSLEAAEKDGPMVNQGQLWVKIAEIYNKIIDIRSDIQKATNPLKPISFSIVRDRVSQWKYTVKTPEGKRGRTTGTPVTMTIRGEKLSENPQYESWVAAMRKTAHGANMNSLVNKTAAGSMKAAIKLHCLQCCCADRESITKCRANSCAFFLFRPYQHNEADEAEQTETTPDQEAA